MRVARCPGRTTQVERALQEYADLLSIVASDRFKPRAYEKAARAVGGYPDDLAGLDARGVLAIPGVGKSIAAKVTEYPDHRERSSSWTSSAPRCPPACAR